MTTTHSDIRRLGLIADVHANLAALTTVLEQFREAGVNTILNAGDTVGYSAYPNECIALLQAHGIVSAMGNYDEAVANCLEDCGCGEAQGELAILRRDSLTWSQEALNESSRTYIRGLPRVVNAELGSMRIAAMHGTPDRLNTFVYPQDVAVLDRIADQTRANLVVLGHTHEPFLCRRGNTLFVNPGSVGKPLHQSSAAYAIVDIEHGGVSIRFCNAAYDVEGNIRDLIAQGLPESIGVLLREGRESPEPGGGAACCHIRHEANS